ncbi:hypothetical protein Tco_0412405 [Tanacetum coccineum]
MRSKRIVKPTKIFDNYVNNTGKNKSKQKNASKKKDMFSNDRNDMADLDGESDLKNCNEIVGNGDRIREGVEPEGGTQVNQAEEMNVNTREEDVRIEECLDDACSMSECISNRMKEHKQESNDGRNKKEDNNSQRTYANMVTKDMKVVNKLDFIPTVINEEGRYKMSVHELRNEEGMNKFLELGPCSKGISALASSLGRPLIMDNMTARMCQFGEGRLDYARVLVEFDVMKGCKDKIEIQYRDKNNNVK